MNLSSLIIEVTRKCNITCYHCLRGDAQKLTMKNEYIDSLLSQVDDIGEITFSGGEPSLAVPVIEYVLESLKRRRISLGSFYIATNGIDISENFVLVCLKLYNYCYEKDRCTIDISNDMYHQAEGGYNTEMLDGLRFTKRKYDREGWDFERGKTLISEGRGVEACKGNRKNVPEIVKTRDDFNEVNIYLNCKGNIVAGCDWSYKSQDKDVNILCQVDHLQEFYDLLEVE